MHSFEQHNLEHIKDIFEEKTGTKLERKHPGHRRLRTALVLAAVLGCLTVGTMASQGLFSVLEGDDLALNAVYEGDGVVSITVENRSDRDLTFQKQLKLTRWITSEEVEPLADAVTFENTDIPAHSTETMVVDLSRAYDMEALEVPLTDDWYYLTLTNNNFTFGQDWFCSVDFAENTTTPVEYPSEFEVDAAVISQIEESLRPYFGKSSMDVQDRRVGEAAYIQSYTALLEDFEGTIISSVSPVLPGNRINLEKPYLTVAAPKEGVIFDETVPVEEQRYLVGQNWFGRDGYFKLVAREGEHALVLSTTVPSAKYEGCGSGVPLLYILTYEKEAVTDEAYAFIYGQLLTFTELESYEVYEDESYVCYEVSSLMYSDVMTYADEYVSCIGGLRWDEQSKQRVQNIYNYYKENLSTLFVYRGA